MFLNGTTSGKTCGCPGPGGQNIIIHAGVFLLNQIPFYIS